MRENSKKKIYKAKVVNIKQVSCSSWYLEFQADVFIEVKAGQFVSLYCNGLTLRRPFSVFSNNDGKVGILFKERGKGTEYLKSLKIGDTVDVSGPFGNSFRLFNKKSLLVGAGIGVAPISFLKTKLDLNGTENLFAAGFLTQKEIPSLIEIDKIYTDDGSCGEKGSVLNYLGQLICEYNPEIIYACGPHIVLKTVASLGKMYNIDTQVSLEKVMACSIGVCRGCVIDILKNGKTVNATVCKDGPVFKGSEVLWQ